jgi:hypothetical protein
MVINVACMVCVQLKWSDEWKTNGDVNHTSEDASHLLCARHAQFE